MSTLQDLSTDDILRKLRVSSVHLVNLDSDDQPKGIASGCLLDCERSRLLITVAHAQQDGAPLAIELGWDEGQRQVVYHKVSRLTTMEFSFKLPQGVETDTLEATDIEINTNIDFAFAKIPITVSPLCQQLNESGKILASDSCTIWTMESITAPNPDQQYGFAGRTKPQLEKHAVVNILSTVFRVRYPLKFVGEQNGFYVFLLPDEKPSPGLFKGCSGAPIIDMDGHVVALHSASSRDRPLIYGVPLNQEKLAALCIESIGLENLPGWKELKEAQENS